MTRTVQAFGASMFFFFLAIALVLQSHSAPIYRAKVLPRISKSLSTAISRRFIPQLQAAIGRAKRTSAAHV
jgi:hypothetical protein